jgi:hypothetical protein
VIKKACDLDLSTRYDAVGARNGDATLKDQ